MIATLTGLMWFGAPYFAFYHIADYLGEVHPDTFANFVPSFRAGMLWLGAIFGGAMVVHWLAAAKWIGAGTGGHLPAWLIRASWLLILALYTDQAFNFAAQQLAFTCPALLPPEPGVYIFDDRPGPCERALIIKGTILFLLPLLLIAISALLRIVQSRRKDAATS